MKKCLVCGSYSKLYSICNKCFRNPFKVEKYRQILARRKELLILRSTYDKKFTEIKNQNTPKFWNSKLSEIKYLENQDGMTKDRIKTAFKFIPKSAKKIIDIGIGHGFLEELLSGRKGLRIYGNDISKRTIKNARSRFEGNFRLESIHRMIYSENFFDCILILEVLEHVSPAKTFQVLSIIKEILDENGSLIVSVPMNEGLEDMSSNPSGHVRTYTESLIRSELELSGFKIIKTKTLYAFSRFYLLKTFISMIIKKWEPNNIVILAKPL